MIVINCTGSDTLELDELADFRRHAVFREEEILEEDAPVVSDDAPRLHFGGERLGKRLD